MRRLLLAILILTNLFTGVAAVRYCDKESNLPECADNDVYNGYWWHNNWVPGLPTQETQMTVNPPIVEGRAVFYGPSVMEATAKYRGLKITDKYLDGVSLLTCGDIGKSVWLKRPNKEWEGPFLVVDCAKRGDLWGIVHYRGEAVEVGFKTAQRWGMASFINMERGKYSVAQWFIPNVQVSKYPPKYVNMLDVVNMEKWFDSINVFSTKKQDEASCRTQYVPPETTGELPLWRVNCKWIQLKDSSIHRLLKDAM